MPLRPHHNFTMSSCRTRLLISFNIFKKKTLFTKKPNPPPPKKKTNKVLNRDTVARNITVALEDIGDPFVTHYAIRDLWARTNLSSTPVVATMGYQSFNHVNAMKLEVPSHGVRLLRMWPLAPLPPPPLPPPPPPPSPPGPRACPADFVAHASGYWHNTNPCPNNVFSNCIEDHVNSTAILCARKCRAAAGCVGFELPSQSDIPSCFIFLNTLAAPFTPYAGALTCTRN